MLCLRTLVKPEKHSFTTAHVRRGGYQGTQSPQEISRFVLLYRFVSISGLTANVIPLSQNQKHKVTFDRHHINTRTQNLMLLCLMTKSSNIEISSNQLLKSPVRLVAPVFDAISSSLYNNKKNQMHYLCPDRSSKHYYSLLPNKTLIFFGLRILKNSLTILGLPEYSLLGLFSKRSIEPSHLFTRALSCNCNELPVKKINSALNFNTFYYFSVYFIR